VTKSETFGAVQIEFLLILKANRTATVDAIHRRLEIPDSARMKIGRAIRQLADDGRIVRVDFEKTQRSKAHGRHVTVWRLAE
jgi:hypothetical protein